MGPHKGKEGMGSDQKGPAIMVRFAKTAQEKQLAWSHQSKGMNP